MALGFCVLRRLYLAGVDDIYVSPSQIRRFNLRTGDTVSGKIRTPKTANAILLYCKVNQINSMPPKMLNRKILFENLTPLFGDETSKNGAWQWQH